MPEQPKRMLTSAGSVLRRGAGLALPALLLATCLFGDCVAVQTAPWLGPVFQEIAAACRDRETQWMVAACLAIYLASLMAVDWRVVGGRFWRARNPQLWLGAVAVIALVRYALNYETAAASRQVPVLLGGMVLGQAARVWACWPREPEQRGRRVAWLLGGLAALLAAAACWHSSAGMEFQYRGATRWRGPWENPNLYGLLMGVGLVVALGMVADGCRMPDAGCRIPVRQWQWWRRRLATAGWTIAAVVFAIGLVKSYSRGAWLGTALALGWLGYQVVRSRVIKLSSDATAKPCRSRREEALTPGNPEPPHVGSYSTETDSCDLVAQLLGSPSAGVAESVGNSRGSLWRWWRGLVRERVAVLTLGVALAVLAFWGLPQSDWRPARRVASVSNAKDFSWRNRVAAWEGALAMMTDKPLAGCGWNQPEPLYDQYYRPARIAEGMAIQLNDYLMLGMTLGLPALLCFAAYVGLSQGGSEGRAVRPGCLPRGGAELDQGGMREGAGGTRCPTLACRAGAVVLLVGFWFDGGLFKLATATAFWVLLELGSSLEADAAATKASRGWDWRAVLRFGDGVEPVPTRGWDWRAVVFALLLGVGALGWARGRDPWQRIWFSLRPAGSAKVECVAVAPKPLKPRPVVVYLHGSGGTLLTDGNDLRQMAELGLAVVAMDYCKTNDAEFARQFTALLEHLQQQPWADPRAVAWLGYSLGAEKATRFALDHPESKPRWLVRLAGGWLPELAGMGRAAVLPPIWLVHGEQDEVFPVAEARRVAAALETNGVPVDLTVLPGLGHWFQPQRGGVYRALGERILTQLRGPEAWTDYQSANVWRAAAWPLWAWWLPAGAWLGGWWLWRRRRGSGEEGEWRRENGSGGVVEDAGYQMADAGCPMPDTRRPKAEMRTRVGAAALRWALRGMAVLVAVAALAVTGGHLLAPRLPVSDRTLAMARRWLVPPGARADFDWLAAQPLWQGRKLASLLSEVELARYNRSLVNWQVDEARYREAVLSPSITRATGEEFGWRGKLWESLYPRVRKEASLETAAATVVAHVRERVTTAAEAGGTGSVSADWRAQLTDAAGFEALCVAGLRAVGIPARLDGAGQAVYWEGTVWRPVPRALPELRF